MSDTTLQECACCMAEADCIQGLCEHCSTYINKLPRQPNSKILRTAIPYHPDDCCGCTDIYHHARNYNVIFECNECGEKRELVLDSDYSLPLGMLSNTKLNEEISELKECTCKANVYGVVDCPVHSL